MEDFIAVSPISKRIHKLAFMLRNIDVNVYIYGEKGVGKSFLASYIAPNAILYNDFVSDFEKEVIVENIEVDFNYEFKRVIATGTTPLYGELKSKFPIEIELKPLSERKEDIPAFVELFFDKVRNEFNIDNKFELSDYDLSENLISLKREIYKYSICGFSDKDGLKELLEFYFFHNFSDNSSYEEVVSLFDEGLIKALLKRYKSKLQVAKHLKINRNTLSKKVSKFEK